MIPSILRPERAPGSVNPEYPTKDTHGQLELSVGTRFCYCTPRQTHQAIDIFGISILHRESCYKWLGGLPATKKVNRVSEHSTAGVCAGFIIRFQFNGFF